MFQPFLRRFVSAADREPSSEKLQRAKDRNRESSVALVGGRAPLRR